LLEKGLSVPDFPFAHKPHLNIFPVAQLRLCYILDVSAVIDDLDRAGIANISHHEHMLLTYATAALQKIPGLRIVGTAREKAGVLSFMMDGFRTEEIRDYLNRKGIAVHGGHHCAQPILRRFGLECTVRATLAVLFHSQVVNTSAAKDRSCQPRPGCLRSGSMRA
jgi:cysteine desulfurase/selenocysteine lyase